MFLKAEAWKQRFGFLCAGHFKQEHYGLLKMWALPMSLKFITRMELLSTFSKTHVLFVAVQALA